MKKQSSVEQAKKYTIMLAIIWTVACFGAFSWIFYKSKQDAYQSVLVMAKAGFDRDIVYRRWNAVHGGVYAPKTDETPANPYLDVPHRDIEVYGKKYTLINPAYMTRQAHTIGKSTSGLLAHITSLKPIRPANKADDWETHALLDIEKTNNEMKSYIDELRDKGTYKEDKNKIYKDIISFHEITNIDDIPHLRYIAGLPVEKGCMKCHEQQGYKVGDIRGGISISEDMKPHWDLMWDNIIRVALLDSISWIIGLVALLLGYKRLKKETLQREDMHKKMMTLSRRAGVADMATNILHDIGNLLGTLNVSVESIHKNERNAKTEDLTLVVELFEKNKDNIGDFLENTKKGKALVPYLKELSVLFNKHKDTQFEEVEELSQKINHIENIIKAQEKKTVMDDADLIEEVDMKDMIEEILSLQKIINEKIEITTEFSEVSNIIADRYKINQVFVDLISNARHAVLASSSEKKSIMISVTQVENEIMISFKDNGVGMEKEVLSKIFRQGFTTKTGHGGEGLHLAYNNIKAAFDGKITAVSDGVEQGSEVVVVIPVGQKKND